MISKALRDEPPVGVSYDAVLAAGRRRRARRQLGIVGGAVLGVAAVAGSAVLVGNLNGGSAISPAGPTSATTSTTAPQPAGTGCVVPARTGGFTEVPDGNASAEELAESARLTEAFGRFPFPTSDDVSMDPAPRFCVIKDSWGMRITLHSAAGDRAVFLEVKPGIRGQAGLCPLPDRQAKCALRKVGEDMVRLTETPAAGPKQPVLSGIDAWRADGTIVRVLETGAEAPKPTPRILDDDALIKIATAPQLKVNWPTPPVLPAEPSAQRAAELTTSLTQSGRLGQGVLVPPGGFRVSQGGYKLNLDLTDGAGVGNLFINLNPPAANTSVSCQNQAGCEVVQLADGRQATLTRQSTGGIQRIMINIVASDGTQIYVMTTNQSDKAASQGKTAPTRPTPPLSADDLFRIGGQSWLHW
jgi:hypothetical protein